VKHSECPAACIEPDTDSDDKQLGRAMHPWILEGCEAFEKEFAVIPEFPCPDGKNPRGWKNATEYRNLVSQWESTVIGKEVIKHDQFQKILGMERGVQGNPLAKAIIAASTPELTIIWQDTDCIMPDGSVLPGTGLWCKSRPDLLAMTDGIDLADLKKTQTIKKHAFQSAIYSYGYHVQAAMAFEGLWRVAQVQANAFTFIAVRDKPPFQCEVHPISVERWLNLGIKQFHKFMFLEKACRDAGYWPNHELIFEPPHPINLNAVNADEIDIPGYLTDEKIPWEMMHEMK